MILSQYKVYKYNTLLSSPNFEVKDTLTKTLSNALTGWDIEAPSNVKNIIVYNKVSISVLRFYSYGSFGNVELKLMKDSSWRFNLI